MLRMRPDQMKSMEKYMAEGFVQRMAVKLRNEFPKETAPLSEEQLRANIRTGIDRAEQHEITDEAHVELYLEYVARFGPDFDTKKETAWTREFLDDKRLTSGQKLERLNQYELLAPRGRI